MAATAPDGVVFFCWVTLAVGEASTCGGRTTIVRDIVGDIIIVVVVVHRLVSSQQESVPLVAWRGDDVSVCFELLLDTAGLLRSKQVGKIQKNIQCSIVMAGNHGRPEWWEKKRSQRSFGLTGRYSKLAVLPQPQ